MGSALLAADSSTPTAAPSRGRARLTKPWNQLKDLTDDEKAKILEIHQKAVDEVKAIDAKEHEDILAVLTDDQKKEIATIEEKDKEAQRASRSKKGATTQPAAAASSEK
jgi:hypothetical protein